MQFCETISETDNYSALTNIEIKKMSRKAMKLLKVIWLYKTCKFSSLKLRSITRKLSKQLKSLRKSQFCCIKSRISLSVSNLDND